MRLLAGLWAGVAAGLQLTSALQYPSPQWRQSDDPEASSAAGRQPQSAQTELHLSKCFQGRYPVSRSSVLQPPESSILTHKPAGSFPSAVSDLLPLLSSQHPTKLTFLPNLSNILHNRCSATQVVAAAENGFLGQLDTIVFRFRPNLCCYVDWFGSGCTLVLVRFWAELVRIPVISNPAGHMSTSAVSLLFSWGKFYRFL